MSPSLFSKSLLVIFMNKIQSVRFAAQKMWTSTRSRGRYSSSKTRTALSAVTEKQQSIKFKSAVINSSNTGGGEGFQSCQSMWHFLSFQPLLLHQNSTVGKNMGGKSSICPNSIFWLFKCNRLCPTPLPVGYNTHIVLLVR